MKKLNFELSSKERAVKHNIKSVSFGVLCIHKHFIFTKLFSVLLFIVRKVLKAVINKSFYINVIQNLC